MDTFVLIAITGVGLGALFFLVASGLSLIYGLMGVLNFAHGTFLIVGAFSGLWISTQVFTTANTWTFLGAMVFGGIAGGIFALIVERLVITRLYERHIEQALVTVGVALVVEAVLSGWFGNDPRLLPTPHWFINTVTIGKAFIPVDRFLYIGSALVLFILLASILRFTRIGLIIRAGVENRAMVGALGINVRLAFSTVFFLGGFAAGLGGVLVGAYQSGVTPLMSGSWLIYGFIVVVVGGMGSLGGSALAALLIGVVDQFTNYYMPGLGDFVIVFLLAAVLLTRPQGLLGKVGR
jgi:branched-chain amino acid transport system permease protein